MCNQHFDAASFKGPAERWVGTIGVILGIIVGIISTVMLLLYWMSTAQGSILSNLLIAGFVGIGMFLVVWALVSLAIAPRFADPASKKARDAAQITHYWPNDKFARLRFENEQLAEIVQKMNG